MLMSQTLEALKNGQLSSFSKCYHLFFCMELLMLLGTFLPITYIQKTCFAYTFCLLCYIIYMKVISTGFNTCRVSNTD